MSAVEDDARGTAGDSGVDSEPPASAARPVQAGRRRDTHRMRPPPDSNAPPRREVPYDAGPDALDTPEYVAPTKPPAETDHKTFELQTVKVTREEYEAEVALRTRPGSNFAQLDIPTGPSTRVLLHRRSRKLLVVLAALGLLAGAGLIALTHGTSATSELPPPSATAPVAPAMEVVIPTTTAEVEATSLPVVEAARTAPSAPPATTHAAAPAKPPRPVATRTTTEPEPAVAPPKTTNPVTTGGTVPLGPAEF